MKKSFKIGLIVLLLLAALGVAAMYVMSHNIPVLEPKGMIGEKEARLIITAAELMLIVVIPVLIFVFFFAWRYGEKKGKGKYTPNWEHNYVAELFWWGVPVVIVAILAILTYRSTHELNPFKPIENGRRPLKIQAVALNWKWLFIYPDLGIATVNYVQFPEQTPLNFEITADAPMNSFWIPQLGGQIYAMPAMRTKLHLIAREPGVFEGRSSNISGKGFAGMYFKAESTNEQAFDSWVNSVRNSGNQLNFSSYGALVEPSEYNPVAYYRLQDSNLFDQIIEKYTVPKR